MGKYIVRPELIEAVQWNGKTSEIEPFTKDKDKDNYKINMSDNTTQITISKRGVEHVININDWIIFNNDTIHVCTNSIFKKAFVELL